MNLKLSESAEIRSSESGCSMGFYINGELNRPLNVLEEHMAKRIQELEDENTRLRSAAQVAFFTPVSVKPDSPEAEELQVIYDELGEALNWRQEVTGED